MQMTWCTSVHFMMLWVMLYEAINWVSLRLIPVRGLYIKEPKDLTEIAQCYFII